MEWCNCHYDQSSGISDYVGYVDPNYDESPTCNRCGKKINKENVIMLLLKEVLILKEKTEILESDLFERKMIESEKAMKQIEKERIEMEKERIEMEKIDKNTGRFEIMDL